MNCSNQPFQAGDILLLLVILLTFDVVVVMLHKINSVVLKADYKELFLYELILCGVLLLFALDVRFNLFTRSGHTVLLIAGWVLRVVLILLVLVIVFFSGKVIRGSLMNTVGPPARAVVLPQLRRRCHLRSHAGAE